MAASSEFAAAPRETSGTEPIDDLPPAEAAHWWRAATRAAAPAVVVVVALAGTPPALAAEVPLPASGGACGQTTELARRACADQARADSLVAQAICANLAEAGARDRCLRQAAADLRSAPGECGEQAEARAEVCEAVGPGAYDPAIRPADFVRGITNPYLPLRPGTVFIYRSGDEQVTVTVTDRTVEILGVTCTVVRDVASVGGEVAEDTLDYYAQDRTGNVWYFGEATAEVEGGVPVSNDGAWIAGVDGAKPGIVMPATPRPGQTYRQEFALGEAEDAARVEALGQRVRVPFGVFSNTLKTLDFTPLEPDAAENKFYAPGVGLVLAVDLETGDREELVSVRRGR